MKIPMESKEETKIQMAPMIDMVFLLIVFFMTSSHLSSQQNIQLQIPSASKGVVPKERPNRWAVNILTDGTVYSGPDLVTIEDLKQMVSARVKAEPTLKVYIRADANAPHEKVKKVMNALSAAGVDEFIFGVFSAGANN